MDDKETAKQIALRKELASINRSLGADGVLLLIFSHTDEGSSMGYQRAGEVPAMHDLLKLIGQLIAHAAYETGKSEASSV